MRRLPPDWHGYQLDVIIQTYDGFWPWRQEWETDASLRARLLAWLQREEQPEVVGCPALFRPVYWLIGW